MKRALLIFIFSLTLQGQWVNGFYVGNNGVETIPNIPWTKYTAVIHFAAYAGVNGSNVGNGTVNMSNIPDTAALIAARPAGKKVLLCLKDNDSFHSAFGQSAASGTRATFVTNITSAVVSNGYDGVDLDWEASVNTTDYIALIAALRAAMPTKLITMDVGDFGGLPTVAAGAQANLDEVNIECYDMDGNGSNNSDCGGVNCSWFNDSVLSAGDPFKNTCQQRTGVITTAGVVAAKIGIGIPYYGRRWAAVQQPLVVGSFSTSTFFYRNLVTDATRWQPANQQYNNTYKGQYLSISSLNEFDSYTGTQQIADIVTWAKSQNFGGYFSFTLDYEYLSTQTGDAKYPLSTALYANVFTSSACTTDITGWCVTGLSPVQDNLLGPLTPYGSNPWIFSDLAQKAVADNMAPAALAQAPALGTACSGTVSLNSGDSFVTTTADMTACVASSVSGWMVFAWNSIDGVGTGRALCPVSSATTTQINCGEPLNQPSFSGITAYTLPPPVTLSGVPIDFQAWTTEKPTVTWNYYDDSKGLYTLHYRMGSADTTYISYARQYADITWQWTLDHGYRLYVAPRAQGLVGQFLRALDGHSERIPYLYNIVQQDVISYGQFLQFCPYCDAREDGYALWFVALGAKVDTDPTRHAQYCTWQNSYAPAWGTIIQTDGSIGENSYANNFSYADATKTFTPPFIYQGSPWRVAIDSKAMEANYESLADTSSQGCNNPTLAATILTSVANVTAWQWNYGRDNVGRGVAYEVNSQSQDQNTVHGAGTATVNLTSTAVVGTGTAFLAHCQFIGFEQPNSPPHVYKFASCTDNTHGTLTVPFGLYGEASNSVATPIDYAPPATGGCNSSATYCFDPNDRNLTRTLPGAIGWLYSKTLNSTYLGWLNELLSATMGGPTAGLTNAVNIDTATLPCSGPACDGYVNDMVTAAPSCSGTGGASPCVNGGSLYANLGKNFGEAWGAPGIDNALAWRLLGAGPGPCSISPTTLGPWTRTQVISQTMTTTCSGGTITWASSGLPAGLSGCNGVTGTSCILSGTLSAAAIYSPTITATASNVASISPSVVVNVVPSISATSLPGGIPGTPYSQSLGASGGTSPLACSLSSGTLAGSGLTLDPAACSIIGTPTTTVATYAFTARVVDANGISASRPLSISVSSPCDLNGDSIVNVQDTQLAINMSLSIIPCTANINGPGVCNSVTIQRVVTASLGGACQAGP